MALTYGVFLLITLTATGQGGLVFIHPAGYINTGISFVLLLHAADENVSTKSS
jgi:hypothetical protein